MFKRDNFVLTVSKIKKCFGSWSLSFQNVKKKKKKSGIFLHKVHWFWNGLDITQNLGLEWLAAISLPKS